MSVSLMSGRVAGRILKLRGAARYGALFAAIASYASTAPLPAVAAVVAPEAGRGAQRTLGSVQDGSALKLAQAWKGEGRGEGGGGQDGKGGAGKEQRKGGGQHQGGGQRQGGGQHQGGGQRQGGGQHQGGGQRQGGGQHQVGGQRQGGGQFQGGGQRQGGGQFQGGGQRQGGGQPQGGGQQQGGGQFQGNRQGRPDDGRTRRQLTGPGREGGNGPRGGESRGEHLRTLHERGQDRREDRFDRRQDRRDDRGERRDDRRDDRGDRRDDRRDNRFDRRDDRRDFRADRRDDRFDRRQGRRDERRQFHRGNDDWRGRRIGNPRIVRDHDGVRLRTRRFRDYRGREWEARSRRYRAVDRRYYNRFRDGRSIYWLPPVAGLALGAYLVSAANADYDVYYNTFRAGPVVPIDRRYTLDEIIADPAIRSKVRSINLDTITFAFGSAEVSDYQAGKLEDLADAMLEAIDDDPRQVFLVAGHTDAVGDYDANLDLSEDRAAAVVELLVSEYGVPAENLEAVGYGEAYLLVETEGPARENRRVVIQAIGDLLARR